MSYFKDRITIGLNLIDSKIKLTRCFDNEFRTFFVCDYISEGKNGEIEIFPYNLKRELYSVEKTTTSTGTKFEPYKYIRYTPEQEKEKGHKSNFPKGVTPPPFIPINVLESFEKEIEIPILILTEGYIKAISGSLKGLNVIGLPSITIYKDKESGLIFDDIISIIETCKVRNVILLYDNDSLDIGKIENELTRRPKQFLSSALNIRDQIRQQNDVIVTWCRGLKLDANGLDDMIVKYPDCWKELLKINPLKGIYFEKLTITRDDNKLIKHLCLNDVKDFYNLHKEKIKDEEFTFYGNQYKFYNGKVNRIFKDVGIFRVGDDFFHIIHRPDHHKNLKPSIELMKRQTILDDFGKEFIRTMPKYISFCNIPDNNNYVQIQNNCFNIYHQIHHEQKQGEYNSITKLLKHIFGDQYKIGLDYLKVMWQQPTHILPILCLVSKERGTGKTTFIDWLNKLWGENSVIVGNDELKNTFNSIYANKTLIMCDESKIDKEHVLEKLKALSTQKTINLHYKFGQMHTVSFFGKIILNSNHEENFINTSDEEMRFWIRKVPVVCEWDAEFESKIENEIPYFIYYLNNTKIEYEKKSRQWFLAEDINTDALKKIVENSKTWLYKTLVDFFQDYFNNVDELCTEIEFTPKDIKEKWFSNNTQVTLPFISNVLKNEFKIKQSEKTVRYWKIKGIVGELTKAIGHTFKIERTFFEKFEEQIIEEQIEIQTELPY